MFRCRKHELPEVFVFGDQQENQAHRVPSLFDCAEQDLLVRKGVRWMKERCVDVLARQLWICVQKGPLIRALGGLPQNELDGDARTVDHRLAKHDLRIDFNAIVNVHRLPSEASRAWSFSASAKS